MEISMSDEVKAEEFRNFLDFLLVRRVCQNFLTMEKVG